MNEYENKDMWDKLEDFVRDPENHSFGCRCREFTIGNTEVFQENAVDNCDCCMYESVENFLMWIEKK